MSQTQEGFCRDPSAIDLASLGGGTPPSLNHRVGLNTADRTKALDNGSDQWNMAGPIKSPRPSNKERLAQSCGVGLFDIANLATTEYHGGHHGVSDLTVIFIHNCGYQSFSNTVSPEDILICYREIQRIHWKILQSWYNLHTFVSGPSIERILDRGFQAFSKLRTSKSKMLSNSTISSRSSPMLTSFHSCHSMPSIWGIILKVYLCWVLVFNGTTNVLLRCLHYSPDSSPLQILRYMPNSYPSVMSPRTDMTYFGMFWKKHVVYLSNIHEFLLFFVLCYVT
jgi:hypothetical protein